MRTKKYGILLTGVFLAVITEIAMAFFFNKVLDANEFLEVLNSLPQGSISDRQIKKVTLEKQERNYSAPSRKNSGNLPIKRALNASEAEH